MNVRENINFQNLLKECPYYIYLEKSDYEKHFGLQTMLKSRAERETFKINNEIAKRLKQIEITPLVTKSTIKDLTSFSEQETLNDLVAEFCKGLNNSFNDENKYNQIMTELTNNKWKIANAVTRVTDFTENSPSLQEANEVIDLLTRTYSLLYNVPDTTLLLALQHISKEDLTKTYGTKDSATGFISQLLKRAHNTTSKISSARIDAAEIARAKAFAEELVKLGHLERKKGTKNNRKSQAVHRLNSYVGSSIGEPMMRQALQNCVADVFNETRDQLQKPNFRVTGRVQGKFEADEIIPDKNGNSRSATIRADLLTDKLFITSRLTGQDKRYLLEGSIGFSEKWYKNFSMDYATNTQKIRNPNVHILSGASVIALINDLADDGGRRDNEDKRRYLNAYVHKDKSIINTVERTGIISALMGSNRELVGQSGMDVNLFFIYNGKFYSALAIVNNLLKDESHNSFNIRYENQIQPGDNQMINAPVKNLTYAKQRSQAVYTKLLQLKMSIDLKSVNQTVLQQLSRLN